MPERKTVSLLTQGRPPLAGFPVAATWLLDPALPTDLVFARLTRWIAGSPEAWVVAEGGAAAVLLALLAARPDLKIAGATLIAPEAWTSVQGRIDLPEEPRLAPGPWQSPGRAAGGAALGAL